MSNIKELRIEFQRKGDVHIDNIVIVPHEHNYKKTKEKFTKVFDSHPIQLGSGIKSIGGVLIQNIHLVFNSEAHLKTRAWSLS